MQSQDGAGAPASEASWILAEAAVSETIDAALEDIDLAAWLLALGDREYQLFAPGEHKACGISRTAAGDIVLICVEAVGDQLMVQHYTPDILTPEHCRLSSTTDVLAGPHWTTVHVTWELRVAPAPGGGSCVFTNSIVSRPTPEFLRTIAIAGISVAEAAAQRADSVAAHNRRETPAFAASIARLARSGASGAMQNL